MRTVIQDSICRGAALLLLLALVTASNLRGQDDSNYHRRLLQSRVCFATLGSTGSSSSSSVDSVDLSGFLGSPFVGGVAGAASAQSMAEQFNAQLNQQINQQFASMFSLKYEQFLDSFKGVDYRGVGPDVFNFRASVFSQNLRTINTFNSNLNRRFTMGINKFCDLLPSEFVAQYARLDIPESVKSQQAKNRPVIKPKSRIGQNLASAASSTQGASSTASNYTAPPRISIDWSCKASPVINQGACGSCYIIAPLESIFITLRIYAQSTLPMSIQEILSCTDSSNGAFGCGGGYFNAAFQYNRVNGTGRAIMYPYNNRAINDGVATECNRTILNTAIYANSKFRIREARFIPFNDCESLVNRLKTQAVAVSIATTNFQFYVNGTYNMANEPPNHGVVLVGYDPFNGYKIKNSWGSAWGNAGYAYVSESTGVCDYAMFPVTGFEDNQIGPCC